MSSFPSFIGHLRDPEQGLAFVAEDAAERDGADLTWAYAWPAGERFGAELGDVVDCAGKSVADLGCGRGHLGLAALRLGAGRVGFFDGSPRPLTWVGAVLVENGLTAAGCCFHHDWGTPLPGGLWEVILGGDILYRPDFVPLIVASVAASLSPAGVAILTDPRLHPDDGLQQAAAEHGLTCDYERRAAGYTVVRLFRANRA